MRKRENKQNHRPILRRFTTWLHGAGAKCALIYAVGTLVLLVLFAAACAPQRYSLSVGAISHQTITATKDVDFKTAADKNLITALNNSTFTLKEKMRYFKKKWLREHIATVVLCVAAWIGLMLLIAQKLRGSDAATLLGAIGVMVAVLFYVILYNRMMAYVEKHAYQAAPEQQKESD